MRPEERRGSPEVPPRTHRWRLKRERERSKQEDGGRDDLSWRTNGSRRRSPAATRHVPLSMDTRTQTWAEGGVDSFRMKLKAAVRRGSRGRVTEKSPEEEPLA